MKIKQIIDDTFSGPITVNDLWVEVQEVFMWKGIHNLLHELNQVALYCLVLLYQITKINIEVPNWCSNQLKEDYRRFGIFKEWFKEHNLQFNLKYFNVGNNPERPHKVFSILFQAGMPLSYSYADKLSNQAINKTN